jgi:hypothetical protein
MMQFDKVSAPCINCKQSVGAEAYIFQGVRICGNCAKIVQRGLDKVKREMDAMLQMYLEVLRVALVKGELNFSPDPVPKNVTGKDLREALVAQMKELANDDERFRTEEPRKEGLGGDVSRLQAGPQDRK